MIIISSPMRLCIRSVRPPCTQCTLGSNWRSPWDKGVKVFFFPLPPETLQNGATWISASYIVALYKTAWNGRKERIQQKRHPLMPPRPGPDPPLIHHPETLPSCLRTLSCHPPKAPVPLSAELTTAGGQVQAVLPEVLAPKSWFSIFKGLYDNSCWHN